MAISQSTSALVEQDFMTSTQFCETFGYPYSTMSARIRKGDIALHQFLGEARPKINVAEAHQVMSAIKRPYTGSALRLVRHDDVKAELKAKSTKIDLFA